MVVKKVVPVGLVPPRDISWCFKPLFMWMRILGVELDPIRNPLSQLTYFYGLMLLITCQWASINFTVNNNVLQNSMPVNPQSKNLNESSQYTTYSWNVRIDMMNHFFLVSIVCPSFFYIAHNRRWVRLWNAMETFDFAYCKFNRVKMRNFLFVVGFVPILSEMTIIILNFEANLRKMPHATTYQICVWYFALFAKLLPISALVLFYSVAWQCAVFYGEIQKNVERYSNKVNQENIRKWRRSLSLADQLVDGINECFGLILLVSIGHFFVEFIARSFYLMNNISRNQPDIIRPIISMLSRIFLIWFIVHCPEKMHHNAVEVAVSLRKIECPDDVNQKSQIFFLAMDMIQRAPRISALGYFDVNVQLIPKLIGTTLTYLVILYQFQTLEDDV